MKYYFAPLEGITGYVYRNAYHKLFHPMDKYFTPFLVANQNKSFKSRDLNDILPENNQGLNVVPQILTNCSDDFIWMAKMLKQFGYNEVNLNLGCPSKTVVAKNKGAGFLAKKEALDRFFDAVISQADISISVKTRIGKDSPDEFNELIEIFNRYPLKELIIHPRVQTDFYKNKPNYEVFKLALERSKNLICYNGDIFTVSDYEAFCSAFPSVNMTMFGRGIIANPNLINAILGQPKLNKQQLKAFHDRIYISYHNILSGDRNVLFKMKELWFYMADLFSNPQKYHKKIKKAGKLQDYEAAVDALFWDQELLDFNAISVEKAGS